MALELEVKRGSIETMLSFDNTSVSYEPTTTIGRLRRKFFQSTSAYSMDATHLLNISLDASNTIQIKGLAHQRRKRLRLRTFTFQAIDPERARTWIDLVTTIAYKDAKPGKNFMVIVNPFGGVGKGRHIFDKQVKPIFDAAGCKCTVAYTERQGHAKEMMQNLNFDPKSLDAVVVVGGDGTIHEVVNGLLSRSDVKATDIPIGIIPCGSGNALNLSMTGIDVGRSARHAALNVVKGKPMKIDVCSVTQGQDQYFSFLMQNYGLGVEADVGTDNIRWMGEFRFTYGAVRAILANRTYPCEIAFKTVASGFEAIKNDYRKLYESGASSSSGQVATPVYGSVNDPVPDDWTRMNDDIMVFLAGKVPWVSTDMLCFPCALPTDGLLDVLIVRRAAVKSRIRAIKLLLLMETGKHVEESEFEYYKVKALRVTPKHQSDTKLSAIDGESVSNMPFQVEVLPQLINVLNIEDKYVPSGV